MAFEESFLEGILEIVTHEVGHSVQSLIPFTQNIFTETFADIISIAQRDGTQGFMSLYAEKAYELNQEHLELAIGDRDELFRTYPYLTERGT